MFAYKRFLLFVVVCITNTQPANIIMPIPGPLGLTMRNAAYRISLDPDVGSFSPPPLQLMDKNVVYVTDALPGTKYNIRIYYTNSTLQNVPLWQGDIYTAPDPPYSLTISKIKEGLVANISWTPPRSGHFSGYTVTIFNTSNLWRPISSIPLSKDIQYTTPELIPGGSYEAQVSTVLYYNENTIRSRAYIAHNFTLKPKPPGKFLVYFRNETALVILWQSLSSETIFSGYKAFIIPPSSGQSTVYVEKKLGTSPEANFTNLVPGRVYSIYVQTNSGGELSSEVSAQYRTVPLPPLSLRYDKFSLTSRSVRISWKSPKGMCEFDKYRISINDGSFAAISIERNDSTTYELNDDFIPGRMYRVSVETLSEKVSSKPASMNVTFRPLPVMHLRTTLNSETNKCKIMWQVYNSSYQHLFKIIYFESEFRNGDSNITLLDADKHQLDTLLLPGRNYSISVQAMSHGIESHRVIVHQATHPCSPMIEKVTSHESNLRITWKSDVNSHQEYYIVIVSGNATDENKINTTEPNIILPHLYPGAVYDINIIAVSHGLHSKPGKYQHIINPLPPTHLMVEKKLSNSMKVHWRVPKDTMFSEYLILYKGEKDKLWKLLSTQNNTEFEINDLTPGETYTTKVYTISHGVESLHSVKMNYTLPPSPVGKLVVLLASNNITLVFSRPPGLVDHYNMSIYATDVSYLNNQILKNTNEPIYNIEIVDLKPGTMYNISIRTVSRSVESDSSEASIRTLPLILSDFVAIEDANSTRRLTLQYTPTPLASTYFDNYKFQISDPNHTTKYKSINDTDLRVIFENLTPGKLYNINMWTVAESILSKPVERLERLRPEQIHNIGARTITDRSVELVWDEPRGEYDDFEVTYTTAENIPLSKITTHPYIVLHKLQPHYNYTFSVLARSGNGNGTLISRSSVPVKATYQTQEAVPGQIENFLPVEVKPRAIKLSWHLSNLSQNGVVLKYFITYNLEGLNDYKGIDVIPSLTQRNIDDLEPSKKYVFRIRAETKVGYGPPSEWIQKMPIWAPPQPGKDAVPREVHKGYESIEIVFKKKFFSEENGPIIGYSVIVAEDTIRTTSVDLPNWFAVQTYGIWPPYQATDMFLPSANETTTKFLIGDEMCNERVIKAYCNGPLRSGATYFVKIRAFTTYDTFTDTLYSLPITTNQAEAPIKIKFKFFIDYKKELTVIIILLILIAIVILTPSTPGYRTRLSRNEVKQLGRNIIRNAVLQHDLAGPPPTDVFSTSVERHRRHEETRREREQSRLSSLSSHSEEHAAYKMESFSCEERPRYVTGDAKYRSDAGHGSVNSYTSLKSTSFGRQRVKIDEWT